MWQRIVNIWRKEVTDSARDRKALRQAILVPVALGIFYAVFNPWISSAMAERAREPMTIPAQGIEQAGQRFVDHLKTFDITLQPYEGDLRAAVQSGDEQAGLFIPAGFQQSIESGRPVTATLVTNSTSGGVFGGSFSGVRIDLAVSTFNKTIAAQRMQERNVDPALLEPVAMETQDVATREQLAGAFASFTLPILVAIVVVQGGLFVAIDVTAGEKERGTLESLFVTPTSDLEVFTGKLLAVFSITCVPLVLTFLGFYLASVLIPFASTGGGSLPFSVILAAILISLPLALLFSVVLMIVSVRTKSFKDAQSASTPVIFAGLIPSMAAAFVQPTNTAMYAIPIYGSAALTGTLATGTPVSPMAYVYAVGGSLVVAAVGVFVGLRVFNRERILYTA